LIYSSKTWAEKAPDIRRGPGALSAFVSWVPSTSQWQIALHAVRAYRPTRALDKRECAEIGNENDPE